MSKRRKRLERIRRNPAHVRFEELDTVLVEFGFDCRQPRSGSSHYVYVRGDVQLTVPFKRPILKRYYVQEALRLIDTIVASEVEEEDDDEPEDVE